MKFGNLAIEEAEKYVGVTACRSSTQNNIFNRWYYGGDVHNPALHWCVVFCAYVYHQVGLDWTDMSGGVKTASCSYVVNHAKRIGKWHPRRDNIWSSIPAPGSLVFYDWNGNGVPDHVGLLVRAFPDGSVETIEGNTSTGGKVFDVGVMRKRREAKYILGWYTPDKLIDDDHPAASPWARNAWDWGIAEGVTDGSNPQSPATREQVVAMLYRMTRVRVRGVKPDVLDNNPDK